MRKLGIMIFLLFVLCDCTFSQEGEPIRIAVTHFAPPFVFQSSNKELSGFDIDLMLHICKELNRPCEFIPMKSSQILSSIVNRKVDIGIGGIDIKPSERRSVGYSIPYMFSEYRILSNQPFKGLGLTDDMLRNKTIGVKKSSSLKNKFKNYAHQENIKFSEFNDTNKLISALYNGTIDLAIVGSATAEYWQSNSSGGLYTLGTPLNFGTEIGIPINSSQHELINSINQAILSYQKSPAYNQLYSMYFGRFS